MFAYGIRECSGTGSVARLGVFSVGVAKKCLGV